MAFDLLRLIKLLHYTSPSPRGNWFDGGLLLVIQAPTPSFFCVCVWYKCTLSRILNVPCLYRLWTDLIIYRKKEREKKNERSFSFPPKFVRHIPCLIHSASPPCPLPPFVLGRCWTDRSVTAPVAEIVTLVGLVGHYWRLLQSLIESSPLAPLFISYI